MIQAVLFDVNETLLDTHSLDHYFIDLFGDAGVRERWFQQLENVWLTAVAVDHYDGCEKLAEAALLMVAGKQHIIPSMRDRIALAKNLDMMSPHTDVLSSLDTLKETGLRLAALTNGTRKSLASQMHYARLDGYFELVLSADEIRRYKPAPEPYNVACQRLALKPSAVLLVTCHAWDIAGGHAAGLRTAFVQRERTILNPIGPKPDFEFDGLSSLSRRLICLRPEGLPRSA